MRDAVIVDAVRTPIGRRGRALSEIHPAELSAHVLRALAERTGLDAATVDFGIWLRGTKELLQYIAPEADAEPSETDSTVVRPRTPPPAKKTVCTAPQ